MFEKKKTPVKTVAPKKTVAPISKKKVDISVGATVTTPDGRAGTICQKWDKQQSTKWYATTAVEFSDGTRTVYYDQDLQGV